MEKIIIAASIYLLIFSCSWDTIEASGYGGGGGGYGSSGASASASASASSFSSSASSSLDSNNYIGGESQPISFGVGQLVANPFLSGLSKGHLGLIGGGGGGGVSLSLHKNLNFNGGGLLGNPGRGGGNNCGSVDCNPNTADDHGFNKLPKGHTSYGSGNPGITFPNTHPGQSPTGGGGGAFGQSFSGSAATASSYANSGSNAGSLGGGNLSPPGSPSQGGSTCLKCNKGQGQHPANSRPEVTYIPPPPPPPPQPVQPSPPLLPRPQLPIQHSAQPPVQYPAHTPQVQRPPQPQVHAPVQPSHSLIAPLQYGENKPWHSPANPNGPSTGGSSNWQPSVNPYPGCSDQSCGGASPGSPHPQGGPAPPRPEGNYPKKGGIAGALLPLFQLPSIAINKQISFGFNGGAAATPTGGYGNGGGCNSGSCGNKKPFGDYGSDNTFAAGGAGSLSSAYGTGSGGHSPNVSGPQFGSGGGCSSGHCSGGGSGGGCSNGNCSGGGSGGPEPGYGSSHGAGSAYSGAFASASASSFSSSKSGSYSRGY